MTKGLIDVELDASGAITALETLGVAVERHLRPVAELTATRIAREAELRVHRRTGQHFKGVVVAEHEGAFIVYPQADPANLGIWLEFGTKRADRHPFLGPALELERGSHARRVADAINAAVAEASR